MRRFRGTQAAKFIPALLQYVVHSLNYASAQTDRHPVYLMASIDKIKDNIYSILKAADPNCIINNYHGCLNSTLLSYGTPFV